MADAIRHLDLCSGLGMFSLGLRLAEPRVRTVAFVERQAYCAAVLLARMEDETLDPAPVWCGELQDVDGSELRGHVDLVTAGYPCQPWSGAGKRKGEEDERWIWPDIKELIADVGPAAVMLENVSSAALQTARSDLIGMGFDVRPGAGPLRIAAEDVGAPHRRARFFLLAYTDGARLQGGYARPPTGRPGPGAGREAVGHADREGLEVERGSGLHDGKRPACRDDVGRHGMPGPWPPPPAGDWRDWPAEAQPGFPGALDGSAARLERIHALGNGVLPQVVAAAWRILTTEDLR